MDPKINQASLMKLGKWTSGNVLIMDVTHHQWLTGELKNCCQSLFLSDGPPPPLMNIHGSVHAIKYYNEENHCLIQSSPFDVRNFLGVLAMSLFMGFPERLKPLS